MAIEILEGGDCYDQEMLPYHPGFTTFVDLGCNTGLFACWLQHYVPGRIKGLMVDANPEVLVDAAWHVDVNNMDVSVLQGVVGSPKADEQAWVTFMVHEANTVSTAQLASIQRPSDYTAITAPTRSIIHEWTKKMGQQRCHVLKMDIEGSELEFLKQETAFLQLVDTIFVEWHNYRVTFKELDAYLISQGFNLVKVLSSDAKSYNGTAFYSK